MKLPFASFISSPFTKNSKVRNRTKSMT